MSTIKWSRGETRRFGIITDAEAAELRISLPGQCLTIPGVAITMEDASTGFGFTLGAVLDVVPPRLYPVSIWTRTGADWLLRGEHRLQISEGC